MTAAIDRQDVRVHAAQAELPGMLAIPAGAAAGGLVVFAHGSGSSRFSSRNRFVADRLNEAGLATLLFDLLTETEHAVDRRSAHLRFDIDLLALRLTGAIDWTRRDARTRELSVGLFGASTGAAAALCTAANRPDLIQAVVSRGGRPDLAGTALPRVTAPTLLIVGSRDEPVITLNRDAADAMTALHQMDIIAGATHLFEEPGALEQVAELAGRWFGRYLAAGA